MKVPGKVKIEWYLLPTPEPSEVKKFFEEVRILLSDFDTTFYTFVCGNNVLCIGKASR